MPITGGVVSGVGDVYVDRGDPSANDFEVGSFTLDTAWHDLDLSGIVTDSDATLVHLYCQLRDDVVGQHFQFRKNGNTNSFNLTGVRTQAAGVWVEYEMCVVLDDNRVVEYRGAVGINDVNVRIRGWWKPG
jgi:hypothetical protein